MLITEVSGSGKTNALLNLIKQQDSDNLIDKNKTFNKTCRNKTFK